MVVNFDLYLSQMFQQLTSTWSPISAAHRERTSLLVCIDSVLQIECIVQVIKLIEVIRYYCLPVNMCTVRINNTYTFSK